MNNEKGQAMTEYIILLAIVSAGFLVVLKGLGKMGIMDMLTKPLTENFARTYRYGHPKAKGYEDGGPEFHPRAVAGGSNFRIFINPKAQ